MEEIKGEYTIEDYLIANRLHLKKSPSYKLQIIFFSFLALICILLIFTDPIDIVLWMLLCMCLILPTYSFTILPIMVKHYYKIQKQIHGEIIISLDGDCICSKSERIESKLKWAFKYLSSDNMLLVFPTPMTFIMIPRRFCKDKEQFERFVNLASKLSNQN